MTPNQYEQMRAFVGDEALEQAGIQGPDERVMVCDACGGDGGGEAMPQWPGDYRWITCRHCDGTGEISVETKLVEMDDLDDAQ